MLRGLGRALVAVIALIGLAAVAVALWLLANGISAKSGPGPLETAAGRRLRALAIPRDAERRRSPVAADQQAIAEGQAHFADHCAGCHANDGSGQTDLGRGLSPRVPDMRLPATQQLSDGDLFYIIENGVRFTGMPAFGTGSAASEAASWRLVLFIRHLPKLSDSEIEDMKALNPKSPEEWREEEEARRFLAGEDHPAAVPSSPHHHQGDHR
jgi:mono/diheme cytochrome c family protein